MTTNRADRNPWIKRMIRIERKSGLEIGGDDIRQANEYGPKPCTGCGSLAYWKPSVGCYVCPSCRKIQADK